MNAFIKAAVRVVMATLVVMFLFGTIDLIGPTDALAEPYLATGSINDRQGKMGQNNRSWRIGWINTLVGEGTTSDAYESYVGFTDPTADNIILFPNSSGIVQLSNNPGFTGTPTDGDLNIYNAGDGLFRAQEMSGDGTITNAGVYTHAAESVETSMILNGPDGYVIVSTDASAGSVAYVAISLTGDTTGSLINAGTISTTTSYINGGELGDTSATSANMLLGNGSSWNSKTMSGDGTLSNTGVLTIGANKIGTGEFNYEEITVFIVNGFVFGNAPATAGSIITGYRPIANIAMAKMANSVIMNGSSVQIFIGAVNWNTYQEWVVTVVKP